MKRCLTFFLAFMVLSMNLAYSLDSFMEISDGHTEFTYMNDLEQHHQGGDSVDCDHCCHGTSHMTGITAQPIHFSQSPSEHFQIFYKQLFVVLKQTPPTPPPIA